MARGRTKLAAQEAAAVSRRLIEVSTGYGTWAEFVRMIGVSPKTADAWTAKNPSVPDTFWLAQIARRSNVSLDWLLLGEGPKLRRREADSGAAQLRAFVEAELRHSEGLEDPEFSAAWDRLLVSGDWHPDEVVVALAVDAVRQRFRENVRLLRHYTGIARLLTAFNAFLARAEAGNVTEPSSENRLLAERAVARLEELLTLPPTGPL